MPARLIPHRVIEIAMLRFFSNAPETTASQTEGPIRPPTNDTMHHSAIQTPMLEVASEKAAIAKPVSTIPGSARNRALFLSTSRPIKGEVRKPNISEIE